MSKKNLYSRKYWGNLRPTHYPLFPALPFSTALVRQKKTFRHS